MVSLVKLTQGLSWASLKTHALSLRMLVGVLLLSCYDVVHDGIDLAVAVLDVDMGNPLLAMHSCRETAAVADHLYCIKAFKTFYE